jgi:hypothetical protein
MSESFNDQVEKMLNRVHPEPSSEDHAAMADPELVGIDMTATTAVSESQDDSLARLLPSVDEDDEDRNDDDRVDQTDLYRYGYIPLHKAYFDEWWWQRGKWAIGQLFMWMIANANRKSRRANYGAGVVVIERGCLYTSEMKLAELSGLHRNSLHANLVLLEEQGEIETVKAARQARSYGLCTLNGTSKPANHCANRSVNHCAGNCADRVHITVQALR